MRAETVKLKMGIYWAKLVWLFRCTFQSWHLAFLLPERWMGAIFVGEGNCGKFRLKLAMHPKFYVVAEPLRWIMATWPEFWQFSTHAPNEKNLEVVTYFWGLSEFRKVWTTFDQFHKKCWRSSKKETRAEQGEGRPVTPGPGSWLPRKMQIMRFCPEIAVI